MRQIKCLSFNDNEAEMLDWVKKQGRFSRYIKGLIRRDIRTEKEGVDPRLAELVKRMLDAQLAGRTVATPMATNVKTPVTGGGEEIDKRLLAGLF